MKTFFRDKQQFPKNYKNKKSEAYEKVRILGKLINLEKNYENMEL